MKRPGADVRAVADFFLYSVFKEPALARRDLRLYVDPPGLSTPGGIRSQPTLRHPSRAGRQPRRRPPAEHGTTDMGSSWRTSQNCCLKEPAQLSAGRRELNPSGTCPRSNCLPGGLPSSGVLLLTTLPPPPPPSPPTPACRASREPTTPGPSCQFPRRAGAISGASEAPASGNLRETAAAGTPLGKRECTAARPGCQSALFRACRGSGGTAGTASFAGPPRPAMSGRPAGERSQAAVARMFRNAVV